MSLSLQPYYVSQYNKGIYFYTYPVGYIYIDMATTLDPFPCLYEIYIKPIGNNSCARVFVLYRGPSTPLLYLTNAASTSPSITFLVSNNTRFYIYYSGPTDIYMDISFTRIAANTSRATNNSTSASPYILRSFDISVFSKSILVKSDVNGYIFINMSNIAYMLRDCSYEVCVASIASGGLRYGSADVCVTEDTGSGIVGVVTIFAASVAFASVSTTLLRIDVGIANINAYVSFNRVTENLANSSPGENTKTPFDYSNNFNSNYYESTIIQGVQFATDSSTQDVFIKMASTTEANMNIPTANDFFLYKCLATTSSTSAISIFYVLVSTGNIGLTQSARSGTPINSTVNTSTFVVTIATTANQTVTCSFQRMIDTTNKLQTT